MNLRDAGWVWEGQGIYLRDYHERAPVPVDSVKRQMELTAEYVDNGKLDGYSILPAVTIETQREQAEAIWDFIATSSPDS